MSKKHVLPSLRLALQQKTSDKSIKIGAENDEYRNRGDVNTGSIRAKKNQQTGNYKG